MQLKPGLTVAAAALAAVLSGCSTTPPSDPDNLCSIFQEKDSWYVAAHGVHNKYGVPINTVMAIMYQESGFVEDAKPPMRWFLFIPYGRGSSAYGYAQAQDEVWERYVQEEGSMFSDRDDFADALDFIAWYMQKTQQINHIPYGDAYRQYLNYHEGWQGYAQGSYQNKDWLIRTAQAVQARSDKYRAQLIKCDLY
ncbi:MAG: transglycosylase SLT domain-containing protein [Candidatus Anaerobiospirillum merdipullorum]|uniref:Transglycosylase SLT domain-containing protein n=1 Tax=Candidatus Anaerobiospirillum merdipullorum TaxID=2838450 RepID=A0A9E2KNU2_9GAMM|nr:transglycosylase SLT domain-containing protein [Candidatus Anaerobiospirillum merdipullorum]